MAKRWNGCLLGQVPSPVEFYRLHSLHQFRCLWLSMCIGIWSSLLVRVCRSGKTMQIGMKKAKSCLERRHLCWWSAQSWALNRQLKYFNIHHFALLSSYLGTFLKLLIKVDERCSNGAPTLTVTVRWLQLYERCSQLDGSAHRHCSFNCFSNYDKQCE